MKYNTRLLCFLGSGAIIYKNQRRKIGLGRENYSIMDGSSADRRFVAGRI